MNIVYLSRRNLETLIKKLDKVKAGGISQCTIIKNDTAHKTFPATVPNLFIMAVENEDYYTECEPGPMAEDASDVCTF